MRHCSHVMIEWVIEVGETRVRHSRTGGHAQLFQFGLLKSFRLCSSVLEPDFHLSFCQRQRSAEFRPLGNRQVLLLAKLLLQRHQLLSGERRTRLTVRFVLAQLAAQLLAGRQFGQTVQ